MHAVHATNVIFLPRSGEVEPFITEFEFADGCRFWWVESDGFFLGSDVVDVDLAVGETHA